MRYKDLIALREVKPEQNVQSIISTVALSLMSNGHDEVNTESLRKEIVKRTGINIPFGVLMELLNELPYVSQADENVVKLGSDASYEPESSTDDKSSEEEVTDMATDAASALFKQKQ